MSTRKQQSRKLAPDALSSKRRLRERHRRKRQRAGVAAAATALLALGGAVAAIGANHTGQPPAVPRRELAPLSSIGKLNPPSTPSSVGPEGVPIPNARRLAGTTSGSMGRPIDAIQCQGAEQVLFHIHAHLTVFVDGTARQIPYGVGIPGAQVSATSLGPYVAAGSCFYWLHTHAADGIIHIESPVQRTYTLGNFFDVWGQKLSPNQVGQVNGPVRALYNGQVFRGNPRDVPLTKHAQIQLDIGRPLVAPVAINFPPGL